MSSCEKCWRESGGCVERYYDLLGVNDCTPEEQAGPGAEECPECKRKTVHIHTKRCTVDDCPAHIFSTPFGIDSSME